MEWIAVNDVNNFGSPALPQQNCTSSVETLNTCLGRCDSSLDLTVSIGCDGAGNWETTAVGADACSSNASECGGPGQPQMPPGGGRRGGGEGGAGGGRRGHQLPRYGMVVGVSRFGGVCGGCWWWWVVVVVTVALTSHVLLPFAIAACAEPPPSINNGTIW